jgi:hypothetical protein
MTVKVKVIKDVTVYDGNKTYGNGGIFDYHGGEEAVNKLVTLGIVEKVSAAPSAPPQKTEAEIAAERRKKAEKKAVKDGLGTADEISKLSDDELFDLVKEKK